MPAAANERAQWLKDAALDRLTDSGELAILKRIALYPRLIEAAAQAHEPHRVAFYLYELASEFHTQWTRGKDLPHLRFIMQNDPETTMARLALVQGIVTVLASGLAPCSGSKRPKKCDNYRYRTRLHAVRRIEPAGEGITGDRMADDQIQRPYRSNEAPARSTPSADVRCRQRSARRTCPPDRTDRSVRRIRPREPAPRCAAARGEGAAAELRPGRLFRCVDSAAAAAPVAAATAAGLRAAERSRASHTPTARDPHAGDGHAPGEAGAYDAGAYHPGNAHLGAGGGGLLRGCSAAEAAHGHYCHRRGARIGGDRNRRRVRLSRDVRRRADLPPHRR